MARLSPDLRQQICYAIAGKGPDEAYLRKRAQDLTVEASVQWLGFLEEEKLPSFYRALDLFVLCTREDPSARSVEGFGLAFLEAQACGVPVIGTDCGGIPDAVGRQCGFLIAQDDDKALAGILLELINDRQKCARLGAAARERVESCCTWNHYMEKMTAIWAQEKIALPRADKMQAA